jgi:hypothetical protein
VSCTRLREKRSNIKKVLMSLAFSPRSAAGFKDIAVQPTSMLFASIGAVAMLVGYSSTMQVLAGPGRSKGHVSWKTPQLSFGILLFFLGFLLLSYMLLCGQDKSTTVILLVALVVFLICEGLELQRINPDPNAPAHQGKPAPVALVEAVALVVIGIYVAGKTGAPSAKATGGVASCLLILSGGYTLARARAEGEADSAGYIGMTVALLLICLLNATRPNGFPSRMPRWLMELQAQMERMQKGAGRLLAGPVLSIPQNTAAMVAGLPAARAGESLSTSLF